MDSERRYKPGDIVPASGQWHILDADGNDTNVERTVTKGEPFPPIPAGYTYGKPDLTQTAWQDNEGDVQR